MTTLSELINKRPASKIEKLYQGVTTKPICDLTVRDLNNISMHILMEAGEVPTGNVIVQALRIIGDWAQQQHKTII